MWPSKSPTYIPSMLSCTLYEDIGIKICTAALFLMVGKLGSNTLLIKFKILYPYDEEQIFGEFDIRKCTCMAWLLSLFSWECATVQNVHTVLCFIPEVL